MYVELVKELHLMPEDEEDEKGIRDSADRQGLDELFGIWLELKKSEIDKLDPGSAQLKEFFENTFAKKYREKADGLFKWVET